MQKGDYLAIPWVFPYLASSEVEAGKNAGPLILGLELVQVQVHSLVSNQAVITSRSKCNPHAMRSNFCLLACRGLSEKCRHVQTDFSSKGYGRTNVQHVSMAFSFYMPAYRPSGGRSSALYPLPSLGEWIPSVAPIQALNL